MKLAKNIDLRSLFKACRDRRLGTRERERQLGATQQFSKGIMLGFLDSDLPELLLSLLPHRDSWQTLGLGLGQALVHNFYLCLKHLSPKLFLFALC